MGKLLLVVVLALTSCANTMTCTKTTGAGVGYASCSGAVDTLDGNRLLTFDLEDVAFGLSVEARILVSVASGSLSVVYRNGDGQRVEAQVFPGSPLAIQDAVRVIFIDETQITLTSAGGIATGIQYTAEFTR